MNCGCDEAFTQSKSSVAQLVARSAVTRLLVHTACNRKVSGSIPGGGACPNFFSFAGYISFCWAGCGFCLFFSCLSLEIQYTASFYFASLCASLLIFLSCGALACEGGACLGRSRGRCLRTWSNFSGGLRFQGSIPSLYMYILTISTGNHGHQ
jgi:hypothetical protein